MVGIFAVVLEGVAPARGSRHLLSALFEGTRDSVGKIIDTICTLQSILLQLRANVATTISFGRVGAADLRWG
eukprot:scaffold26860_cov53-Phaeocystis_antarctica.AAC.1